jgi:hypothetical protein
MKTKLSESQISALRELAKGQMGKVISKDDGDSLINAGLAKSGLNGPMITPLGKKLLADLK